MTWRHDQRLSAHYQNSLLCRSFSAQHSYSCGTGFNSSLLSAVQKGDFCFWWQCHKFSRKPSAFWKALLVCNATSRTGVVDCSDMLACYKHLSIYISGPHLCREQSDAPPLSLLTLPVIILYPWIETLQHWSKYLLCFELSKNCILSPITLMQRLQLVLSGQSLGCAVIASLLEAAPSLIRNTMARIITSSIAERQSRSKVLDTQELTFWPRHGIGHWPEISRTSEGRANLLVYTYQPIRIT